MYKNLYGKATTIVKGNTCMKFYDMARPLYLETDTSGVDIGAWCLQVRATMNSRCFEMPDNAIFWPIAIASKCLSSANWFTAT